MNLNTKVNFSRLAANWSQYWTWYQLSVTELPPRAGPAGSQRVSLSAALSCHWMPGAQPLLSQACASAVLEGMWIYWTASTYFFSTLICAQNNPCLSFGPYNVISFKMALDFCTVLLWVIVPFFKFIFISDREYVCACTFIWESTLDSASSHCNP